MRIPSQRDLSYIREGRWHGAFYRVRSRFLHRLNLHHTRRIGPLVDEDGDASYVIRCEWCGLSKREAVDPYAKIRRAAASR